MGGAIHYNWVSFLLRAQCGNFDMWGEYFQLCTQVVGFYTSLVPPIADIDALSGAITSGVVNNSSLTPQELNRIMSKIPGHIVPSSPELRETKV